jgi:hypothetical protein
MFSKIREAFRSFTGAPEDRSKIDAGQQDAPPTTVTTTAAGHIYLNPQVANIASDPTPFMADFSPDRWGMQGETIAIGGGTQLASKPIRGTKRKTKKGKSTPVKPLIKVEITPKSVLGELECRPTMMALDGLSFKIAMLELKLPFITQNFAREEVQSLIDLLKNRLRYNELDKSGLPFSQFFSQFDSTDDQKIKALCDKHDLVKKSADIFIPELPDEAVQIMVAYGAKVEELTALKPRYFVIASKEDFKDAYKKRDPILLVQSPFGFYYYILGAWDTEMLYLPEL